MSFGLYFHIPYCQQLCPYCDFAKYKTGRDENFEDYHQLLLKEARFHLQKNPNQIISSVAFGGGTPSLYPTHLYDDLLGKLLRMGFIFSDDLELSMEIDPGTINRDSLRQLKALGFKRFSVGAQSFQDENLERIGRKHRRSDILKMVKALQSLDAQFSLDLLFSLPFQTLESLEKDLEDFVVANPGHISAYILDLPSAHKMNRDRPEVELELSMFKRIKEKLSLAGYTRYEISNYAKPGQESKHNQLYWSDRGYVGIGLSAHSYLPKLGDWGARFWNPRTMKGYADLVNTLSENENSLSASYQDVYGSNLELLSLEESMTDFCHTHLRTMSGLSDNALRQKYGEPPLVRVQTRLQSLIKSGFIQEKNGTYTLSEEGILISNQVFEKLLFTP